MIRRNIRFIIQRRVGFTMAIVTGALGIMNFILIMVNKGKSPFQAFITLDVFTLLIYATISYATTFKESRIAQMVQVLTFTVAGIVTIIASDSGSLAEVNVLAYAILLCIQYGFFNKNFVLKLILMGLSFMWVKFRLESIKSDALPLSTHVPTIFYFFFYLYLVWVIFAEEIKEYKTQTKELRQEIDKNEIFVSFGKNVTSVIHNLKNKLMSISTFNELIADSESPEIRKYCKHQSEVIQETEELLLNLNFAVKSRQEVNPKEISLGKMIRSVVDLFNANLKFHKEVTVHLDLTEDDYIVLSPLEASQLLENIIRNAWEAIKENKKGENIYITTKKIEKELLLSIKDEGIGMPFCKPCIKKDCINCKEFQIGRTTKETGTGVGMIFVQNLMDKISGRLNIKSVYLEGTEVQLFFESITRNNNDYLVD